MHHRSDTVVLELTPEARARVVDLEREREPRLGPGGAWEPILNWANKWTGAVVRLAGLLHIAEYPISGHAMPIEADTIDRATVLGYYFADHALATFNYMGADPKTGPATVLLDWLAREGKPEMAVRDMHRALQGRKQFRTAGQVHEAVAVLVDHGYVREAPHPSRTRGRPPSPKYRIHPNITGTGDSA